MLIQNFIMSALETHGIMDLNEQAQHAKYFNCSFIMNCQMIVDILGGIGAIMNPNAGLGDFFPVILGFKMLKHQLDKFFSGKINSKELTEKFTEWQNKLPKEFNNYGFLNMVGKDKKTDIQDYIKVNNNQSTNKIFEVKQHKEEDEDEIDTGAKKNTFFLFFLF